MSDVLIKILVLIVVTLPWLWLGVAYAVAFWYGRRDTQLNNVLRWFMPPIVGLLPILLTNAKMRFTLDTERLIFWLLLLLLTSYPCFELWRRWSGRVTEPGYAHARELLLLHKPPASAIEENDGWRVPANVAPDTRPRISTRSFLLVIGILCVWVIAMVLMYSTF